MKIGVVLNGISLAKDVFYRKYLPAMLREHQVDVFETRSINDAVSISAKLTGKRYNVIMAAGGDGTVNQVVNGMLSEELANPVLPSLCVLPLGSGNDFARALNQKASVESLLKRLAGGKMKEIDVGEITFCSSPRGEAAQSLRYFVNVADVGMGPPVVRGVLDSGRAFGSAIAYYLSIIKTFFTYQPVLLHASGDGWEWKKKMRTFAMGNGKYFGNGLCIAPDAVLDDGLLDIFAVGPVSVLDFIIQSIPLRQSRKIRHKEVSYLRSRRVTLTSPSAVEIEADGEIIGWLPATVAISTRKLRLLID